MTKHEYMQWYEEAVPDTEHTLDEAARIAQLKPATLKRWLREARLPNCGDDGESRLRLREVLQRYFPAGSGK